MPFRKSFNALDLAELKRAYVVWLHLAIIFLNFLQGQASNSHSTESQKLHRLFLNMKYKWLAGCHARWRIKPQTENKNKLGVVQESTERSDTTGL